MEMIFEAKSILTLACLIPLSVLLFVGCSSAGQKNMENAAAIVNGTALPQDELDMALENFLKHQQMYGMEFDSTRTDSVRNMILDSMISNELLYQESQKAGFEVTDAEVAQEIEMIISRYPSREDFEKSLVDQGVTEEALRKQIDRNSAIRKWIDGDVVTKIVVPEEDIAKYYEDNKAQYTHGEGIAAKHILLTIKEDAPEESLQVKKANLEAILERVKGGEDFSSLAVEHSDCPSASKGGDLGFFSKGQMVKPFEEAAFALEKGEVSDIVQTQFGFHIIKIYDKRGEGTASLDEVRESISENMKSQLIKETLDSMIEELKSKGDIEILV
jgi:peptidyl-prolyl cis-trans isomerase C